MYFDVTDVTTHSTLDRDETDKLFCAFALLCLYFSFVNNTIIPSITVQVRPERVTFDASYT